MSEQIWVHSKWKCEELHAESVEFKIPVQDGEAQGVGQFVVSRNPEGLLSIDIRTNLHGDASIADGTYDFHLNQWAADRIERHPDRMKAVFRCFS
ncbi:MAG: hypothetical protein HYY23_18395 [Verrucomicrobia bacterium]|nr:hypothetical protein [Verrucomicrobiota bacterium]